jgi:hypothetical protein
MSPMAVPICANGRRAMVATLGIRVVGDLYGTDAAQAGAVWTPVETVVGGLGGDAGEILGGVRLLLYRSDSRACSTIRS